ncbi:MAG: flagellar export protein FliJ [Magnetococcus sp. YQC-5]
MNRFARLEELRRLKEETAGQAFARSLAQIEELRHRIVELDRMSQEEQNAAKEALAGPQRPDPALLAQFLMGQKWRRQRLETALGKARQESEAAREVWRLARMQLQQAETLAEKESLRLKLEQRRKENKEMDQVGIYRSSHLQDGHHQARRGTA